MKLFNCLKICSFFVVFVACSAMGANHGYLLPSGQSLSDSVSKHVHWMRDYGSYVWVTGDPRLARELERSGIEFTRVENRAQLQVHDFRFDPLSLRMDLPEAPRRMDGAGLALVQFRGPVARADVALLQQAGVEVLQYYPHHAYLVWGQPDQIAGLRSADAVRWSGDFSSEFRLHPRLSEFQGPIENLNVHFYNDGNPSAVVAMLESQGATVLDYWPAQPDRRLWDAKVVMDASQVATLAFVPQVISVNYMSPEPELEDESGSQTLADNIGGNNVPVPGYEDWLTESGVDGSGVIWAISDSGMYYDHPDFAGRIAGGFSYPGCTNVPHPGAERPAGGGHGTHVAGIVGGSGAGGFVDGVGHLYGLGVAPGVEFFAQNPICGTQSSWPPAGGWSVLSRDALAGGAIGANNSWTSGEGAAHGYQNSERTHDIMVLDGNFDSGIYEPFQIVFSAGNSGPGAQTLTAPKEAKNVVVTAATQTYRAGDIDNLAGFSSRGPAVDGRTLPTVGAPGQQVSSAIKPSATSCTQTIAGTNGLYSFCSGTSMAAPHVSGALALMSDWWRQNNAGQDFSPAMGKALLINTARNDIGGGTSVPNNNMGWGRTDLSPLLDADSEVLFEFWDQEFLFEDSGDELTISVGVVDPGQPLRVSLVWSDAPGAVGANPALVNDLDLEVTTGGNLYLGNVFSSGWSTTGGSPDRLNNLENVFVESPGGSAEITIRAHQIAGSVLVNDPGIDTAQHFALVCQNCQEQADFTLAVTPVTQMVCAPDDGEFDIEIGSILGFDDLVDLSVDNLDPVLGMTLSETTVVPPATAELTISGTGGVGTASFTFDLVGESTTGTKTQPLVLEVTEQEPGLTQLLTPVDQAADTSLTPIFSWDEMIDSDSYQIQIATDSGFGSIVIDEIVTESEFVPVQDLDLGTTYFWRVRGQNFCGDGGWSDVFSFSTRLEPEADFSATSFAFVVESGDSDSDSLVINNVGTGNLNFDIETDTPGGSLTSGRGFTGGFHPDNWELVNSPANTGGFVTVDDGPPVEVFVTGGDDGVGGDTDFQIEIPMDGTITFDWGYQSTDTSTFDTGGYAINGSYTQLAANNSQVPFFNETATVEVSAGDIFAFRVNTTDGLFGPGVFGATNFDFAPAVCGGDIVPVPWLTATPASGTVPEGDSETVTVSVNAAGLAPGEYEGWLCVSTNDPSAEMVPMMVDLTVEGDTVPTDPVAEITPEILEATVDQDEIEILTLNVSNASGFATLDWSIDTADAPSPGDAPPYLAPLGAARGEIQPDSDLVPPQVALPAPQNAPMTGDIFEGFEDISTLPAEGWAIINNSDPVGTNNWFQGNPTNFPAHEGPDDSYIAVNFASGAAGGVISNWLLTPEVVLENGTELRFWTRHSTSSTFPDRMQVRLSTAGSSTDVGTTADSVGDFDILLEDINEDMTYPGYPEVWTEFVITIEGLSEPVTGRFGFRYYSPDWETVGSLVGIDTLSITQPIDETGCDFPTSVPWLSVDPDSGSVAVGDDQDVDVILDTAGLAEGLYQALLCVTTNDPDAPLIEVPVSLTVTEPVPDPAELAVDPTELSFGEVDLGDAATLGFTVSNAAEPGAESLELSTLNLSGDAEFAITGGDCAVGTILEPGEDCGVDVTFTPGTVDAFSASVVIASTDGQSDSVSLAGDGVQDPAILDVDPTDLAFGEVDLGDAATLSFVVSNVADPGAESLELSTLDLSGDGEFAITGGDCAVGTELEPGDSCTAEVTFTPSAVDSFSGSVAIATTDGQSDSVLLSGEGVQDPAILDVDPTDLVFGTVIVGEDATLGFVVSNAADPGAMSLELSTLALSGDAEFAITGGDCGAGTVLEPGESCGVDVTFTPSDGDSYAGSILVDTTNGQSATVILSGEGELLPAELEVDTTLLDFDEVPVDRDETLVFTVSNAAQSNAASLTLSAIDLTGAAEFSLTGGDCAVGTELAPSESCTVEVTFAPTAEATSSAVVAVVTAAGDIRTVSLSGQSFELPEEVFSDRFEE
jgi:hypothetical protein